MSSRAHRIVPIKGLFSSELYDEASIAEARVSDSLSMWAGEDVEKRTAILGESVTVGGHNYTLKSTPPKDAFQLWTDGISVHDATDERFSAIVRDWGIITRTFIVSAVKRQPKWSKELEALPEEIEEELSRRLPKFVSPNQLKMLEQLDVQRLVIIDRHMFGICPRDDGPSYVADAVFSLLIDSMPISEMGIEGQVLILCNHEGIVRAIGYALERVLSKFEIDDAERGIIQGVRAAGGPYAPVKIKDHEYEIRARRGFGNSEPSVIEYYLTVDGGPIAGADQDARQDFLDNRGSIAEALSRPLSISIDDSPGPLYGL